MAAAKSAFLQKFQSKISVVAKDGSHAKVGDVRDFFFECFVRVFLMLSVCLSVCLSCRLFPSANNPYP